MDGGKVFCMSIKLVGILMVSLSSAFVGFILASNIKKEILYLQDFIDVLDCMECELNFRLSPLPHLCDYAAQKGNRLNSLFSTLACELNDQVLPDVVRCMKAAINKHQELPRIIQELLLDFGYSLGKFDLKGQLISFNAMRQKCASLLAEREENKHNRIRCYQTLGLCAGVIITILLL
jgi:stage III sporulation protein AB